MVSSPLRILVIILSFLAVLLELAGMLTPAWLRLEMVAKDFRVHADIGVWFGVTCVKNGPFGRETCVTTSTGQFEEDSLSLLVKLKALTTSGLALGVVGLIACFVVCQQDRSDACRRGTIAVSVLAWISSEKYDKVRTKLKQSEETSDLQTSADEQKTRKRKPAKKIYDSSEESSEEDEGDIEGNSDVIGCTPPPTKRPALETPKAPPRLPTEALAITPGQSEEPSHRHNIGPNAVSQILTVLETMREENREIKRMMQRLLARSAVDSQPVELPEDVCFPIQTDIHMSIFDELMNEPTKMTSVVRYLSMFAGGDVRESVDRIMKVAITTQLAREYNLKGMKGKKKFEGLQLLNLLYTILTVAAVAYYLYYYMRADEDLELIAQLSALDDVSIDIPWATSISGAGSLFAFLAAAFVSGELCQKQQTSSTSHPPIKHIEPFVVVNSQC